MENNSGQKPVAGHRDVARTCFSGQTGRTNNQSHDEDGSYGSVEWHRFGSCPPVESVSSDADHRPLRPAPTYNPSAQGPGSSSASSEKGYTTSGQESDVAPAASSGYAKLPFARPEPGFDPADGQFVRQFYRMAGSTHNVLGHLRQPEPTTRERCLQSLDDLPSATGHAPNEPERAFVEETLRNNTGRLEGYKATLEGQPTVPMEAFDRLAQDYEDAILYGARDRAAYEAGAMASLLARDDQIGALRRAPDATQPQQASQPDKNLQSRRNAREKETEQLRPQSSECISLEAGMAPLQEQADQRCRAVIVATEGVVRRAYEQRIKTLAERLEQCENRPERHRLKMTSLDALADEVAELRQENAELRDILTEYEDADNRGTSTNDDDEAPEEGGGEERTAPSEASVHGEVGPRAKDAEEAPTHAVLQNEATLGTRGPSSGYLLLKNAFADSQRLRAAHREVAILKADLEQAKQNQRDLRENNGDLAPRLNRALRRLAARDSEIALLQAQVVEAENRAARDLAAIKGRGRERTVDEELLKQWNDATERNNLQILTALADEDDMLATWKEDVQRLFRGHRNGQLTEEAGTYSFDQMVPL